MNDQIASKPPLLTPSTRELTKEEKIRALQGRIATDTAALSELMWGHTEDAFAAKIKSQARPWPVQFGKIMDATCRVMKLDKYDICKRGRGMPISAYQGLMAVTFLIKESTDAQFWEIGNFLGKRVASQASDAYKSALSEIHNNPRFAATVSSIRQEVVS